MRKLIRKALLITGILMVLMLAGCSGSMSPIAINTTLTVDTSFDGERVMTAEIPSNIFRSVFGSDAEAIETVINQYIPGDMYCTAAANDDGSAVIEMHIDFASRKEYQEKIETICGANTSETAITPVITFDYSRSILKTGYTIEENFTSLDLFYWLSDALAAEYPALEGKSLDEIFELGTTTVVFDGESTEMTDYIQISTIESNAFDSISVAAALGEDDESVEAEITYVVSNKVVSTLGDKLDTLMDGIVPENGTLTYQDDSSSRIYTLTFETSTIASYITSMNKALRTSGTVFEVTTEGDTDSLSAKKSVTQYYDGSYFLDFTDADTKMTYILRVSADYSVESCESIYGYLDEENSIYSDDTCEITMTVSSSDEVTTVLGFAVDIEEVDVTTEVHSDSNIERTITFRLSLDADDLVGSSILGNLQTAAQGWPEEGEMSVQKETLLGYVQYSIILSADSVDEMTEMTIAVLGGSDNEGSSSDTTNSLLTGGTESHKNPWTIHCSFEDTLNFSWFLRGSQISDGIHYTLIYPSGFKVSFAENNIYEDGATDGATVMCSTYDKILTVKTTAQKANMEGIIIMIIWGLSVLSIGVLLLLNIGDIVSLFKNKTIDTTRAGFFKGKNLMSMTVFTVAVVCFVIMSIRLLFKVY